MFVLRDSPMEPFLWIIPVEQKLEMYSTPFGKSLYMDIYGPDEFVHKSQIKNRNVKFFHFILIRFVESGFWLFIILAFLFLFFFSCFPFFLLFFLFFLFWSWLDHLSLSRLSYLLNLEPLETLIQEDSEQGEVRMFIKPQSKKSLKKQQQQQQQQ